MTTFVLKKYEDKKEEDASTNIENKEENKESEVVIKVYGSVAEIVANALNKVLENKVEVKEIAEDQESDTVVKAITTEDINSKPLDTFNSINKNDIVFISNNGFKTAQEEWFLTNIENKTSNVFYSVESLIKFVTRKLGV